MKKLINTLVLCMCVATFFSAYELIAGGSRGGGRGHHRKSGHGRSASSVAGRGITRGGHHRGSHHKSKRRSRRGKGRFQHRQKASHHGRGGGGRSIEKKFGRSSSNRRGHTRHRMDRGGSSHRQRNNNRRRGQQRTTDRMNRRSTERMLRRRRLENSFRNGDHSDQDRSGDNRHLLRRLNRSGNRRISNKRVDIDQTSDITIVNSSGVFVPINSPDSAAVINTTGVPAVPTAVAFPVDVAGISTVPDISAFVPIPGAVITPGFLQTTSGQTSLVGELVPGITQSSNLGLISTAPAFNTVVVSPL